MKVLLAAIILFASLGMTGCDSVSSFQGKEVIATKKMKEKVRKVQAALQEHCDSILYREARRLVDSIEHNAAK